MPDVFNSHKQVESVEQNSSKKQIEVKKPEKKFKTPEDMDRHELPGHNHNPFAAYCYYPDHVNFVNADPEEKVVLLLRRHPITNLSWISIAFLMVIAPSFFVLIAPFSLLPPGFQVVLTILWYLIVTAFILEEFLSWFFHVNIVTDERIIEVDLTVVVGGAPRTFFRYGNVVIQTASEIPKIEFEAIPNPDAVARVLRELRIEEEQEKLEGRVR